jgi:peptide/nickel transport system permease protein
MTDEPTTQEAEAAAAPTEAERAALAVPSWRKALRRYRKQLRKGWAIYKYSKAGLIGLGIMIAFVFLAVFAPFLTPYSVDFTAPAIDVFRADTVTVQIPQDASIGLNEPLKEHWRTPIGYTNAQQQVMESVTVYSAEGHAVKFMLGKKPIGGGGIGMEVTSNITRAIPAGIHYMFPVTFMGDYFYGVGNGSLYELTYAGLSLSTEVSLGFTPTFHSNLWNRYGNQNNQGQLYFAMANETMVSVYAKIPPNINIGELNPKEFYSSVDISTIVGPAFNNSRILGDPILLRGPDLTAPNASLVIVPTTNGVTALELRVLRSGSSVSGVQLGQVVWSVEYKELETKFDHSVVPVEGRPISISKENPSEMEGKERIVLAAENGYLYSIWRANGTLGWASTTLANVRIREPTVTAIYPTYRGVFVITGVSHLAGTELGFIAAVDPETGTIKGNGTWYNTTTSLLVGQPQFVPSSLNYIVSTTTGDIIIFDQRMGTKATFKAPGGAATVAVYVGNIVNSIGSQQGNYFGIMTKDGKLYMQSVTGSYLAPLAPGTYKSGNRYILGTDYFGHDIWTLLIYATRTELVVGIVAAAISALLGTFVGLVSGFYGGWLDTLLMRLTDIFLTLPVLVVALLMAAVLGPSITNIIIIIAIFSWAGVARVIRAQTLSLKSRAFIDAARVSGASNYAIIMRHLAPNVVPLTFLYMVFTISGAIITEAILAFLGMGDPTAVTWGMMLQYLRITGNTLSAPWWLLPPGVCITMFSLAFYLIGRAFDEVVNPRLRAR